MAITDLNKHIRGKMHIKRGDTIPFIGWSKTMSRNELAVTFAEAGFTIGAEIGVRKGVYSRVLCDAIPNLRLMCVDTWAPFEGGRPSAERQEIYFDSAKKRLAGFNVEFVRKTSMEAVEEVANGSLDFVYIDAMHDFDNCMMDIIRWSPKVRSGGIVAGHDYAFIPRCGVVWAVNAYTVAHNISSWYLTHEDMSSPEPYPSWFWVRE